MQKLTLEQYKKKLPKCYERLLRLQALKQKAAIKLQELRAKRYAGKNQKLV